MHANCRSTFSIVIPKDFKIKDSKQPTELPEFVEAKTIKEANAFAQNVLGIQADYKGIDIKAANEWNKGLYDAKKDFPEVLSQINFVGSSQARNKLMKEIYAEWYYERYTEGMTSKELSEKGVEEYFREQAKKRARESVPNIKKDNMASSFSEKHIDHFPEELKERMRQALGITMNDKYFNDYEKVITNGKMMSEGKFHPEGAFDVKATFDHEFAHQIDDYLKVSESKTIQSVYNSRTPEQLTEGLSTYSWKNTNSNRYGEMVAEAWSEYKNNPEPRDIANAIGREIERLWNTRNK